MTSLKKQLGAAVTVLLIAVSVEGFGLPSFQKSENACKNLSFAEKVGKSCVQGLLVGSLALPQIAAAVSGGGLDYANLDITGQDFSNQKYKGKDFTQVRSLFDI